VLGSSKRSFGITFLVWSTRSQYTCGVFLFLFGATTLGHLFIFFDVIGLCKRTFSFLFLRQQLQYFDFFFFFCLISFIGVISFKQSCCLIDGNGFILCILLHDFERFLFWLHSFRLQLWDIFDLHVFIVSVVLKTK